MEITQFKEKLPFINMGKFCDRAGIHYTNMSNYVNGKLNPNAETISKINKALKDIGGELLETKISGRG